MTKKINLNQLLTNMSRIDNVKYKNLSELIEIQHDVYQKFFKTLRIVNEEVTLIFENKQDAQIFYMDCHYGRRLLRKVGVSYDLTHENRLILRPILNIIDLIDSRQPGLCQLSQQLNINFKLEYKQSFSSTTLDLYIQQGQIVDSKCVIVISETLPYLALGQLITLIRNENDFNRLNGQFVIQESETIYESTRTSYPNALYPQESRTSQERRTRSRVRNFLKNGPTVAPAA